MAIYHLRVKSIARAAGRSAVAAAAYRAGERIRDERTGKLHNHTARKDVSHKEIVLPAALDPQQMSWASDRARLWNTAEKAEVRRDARVAREYEVALPMELSMPQQVNLTREFAQELAQRHRVAVDFAVHEPRAGGDGRNFHAHLLTTVREVSAAGLGAKAGLDMSSTTRQQLGLAPGIAELHAIRQRWAELTNAALQSAGLEVRVDHRSYQARNLDREPHPQIPYPAVLAERRGLRSDTADYLRERYRQRVEERQLQRAERAFESASSSSPSARQTLEQLRERAQQAWLEQRRGAARSPDPQPGPVAERDHEL